MPLALVDLPTQWERAIEPKATQVLQPGVSASSNSERALVEAARSGDRAAFSRLYEMHGPLVHGIVLARVARSDAEDLTQDVFIRAWRSLATLDDADAFAPWIAAIARNLAASWGRRWWRRVASLRIAKSAGTPVRTVPPPSAARDDDMADRELSPDDILAAIRALPQAYHEPLILRLFESMTGPQIADKLGMTHGSVRVNLCKGMQMLKDHLERGGGASS